MANQLLTELRRTKFVIKILHRYGLQAFDGSSKESSSRREITELVEYEF